jgi:hypothetical protein
MRCIRAAPAFFGTVGHLLRRSNLLTINAFYNMKNKTMAVVAALLLSAGIAFSFSGASGSECCVPAAECTTADQSCCDMPCCDLPCCE